MEYWIWLSRIEGVGAVRMKRLLEVFESPKNIWKQSKASLLKVPGIGEDLANKLLNEKYRSYLEVYCDYMKQHDIKMVTIKQEQYPECLRHIYDAPVILYYKGNFDLVKQNSMAMVGCRDSTIYGKKVALHFSYHLAKHGIIIVSGMAKGIDTYSHIGCMKAGGRTIAVMGNGLDKTYPKENSALQEQILQTGGLLLSEYVIGTKPTPHQFPARNRIISGLSRGILVVEAKEKSGSLNTVDFALEQGKDVFAIPGDITSIHSIGTNELIKQGAQCVTCAEELLKFY